MKTFIIPLLFAVLIFTGCGTSLDSPGESIIAPPDATINTAPESIEYQSLAGDVSENISIVVLSKDGRPIANVKLYISGSFAYPRDPARYYLCKNVGGNNCTSSGFTAETNEDGVYNFSIFIPATVNGVSNTFQDNIDIRSGTLYKAIPIKVGS